MFIKKVLRLISSNVLFWRIRHFFQPNWMDSYEQKDSTHILEIVKKFKCKAILDFGCASGKTIEDIKDLSPEEMHVFGIDVNPSAIEFCNIKFNKKYNSGFEFNENFDLIKIKNFLKIAKTEKFDLIIFDRVLYCLTDDKLLALLRTACSTTKMIFIDDFDHGDRTYKSDYHHRDWMNVLLKFNFNLLEKNNTFYKNVDGAFAKSMLFEFEEDN